MKIYIKIVFVLLIVFGLFNLSYASSPTGMKIGEINFDTDKKELSITVCNWDKKDQNLGDYYVWISNGGKKIKKTFSKKYILNYSCGITMVEAEELNINRGGTYDLRIRLESINGKLKDEKNTSFFIEYEKRFMVPDEPQADLIVKNLEFDKNKRIITAKICNIGENYRLRGRYYSSTLFVHNNKKAKVILKEKDIWGDSCWTAEMNVKKLKISKIGTYMVEVIADGGNAIEEKTHNKYDTSKEENNRKQIEITIEESKKVIIKHRKKTPTKKNMSSMSLRERIAFMRNNKTQKNTGKTTKRSRTKTTKRKGFRRRSFNHKARSSNYKSKTFHSVLRSKYPYLFQR